MRDQEALTDIIQAIELIFQYIGSTDRQTFARNIEKQDAILRRITIIGEATKRLSPEFRQQHPEIPWKKMAGMRDVVMHRYDEIELDEIWNAVTEDFPDIYPGLCTLRK
jgi:uncharacterized protein with HEPN domain